MRISAPEAGSRRIARGRWGNGRDAREERDDRRGEGRARRSRHTVPAPHERGPARFLMRILVVS